MENFINPSVLTGPAALFTGVFFAIYSVICPVYDKAWLHEKMRGGALW